MLATDGGCPSIPRSLGRVAPKSGGVHTYAPAPIACDPLRSHKNTCDYAPMPAPLSSSEYFSSMSGRASAGARRPWGRAPTDAQARLAAHQRCGRPCSSLWPGGLLQKDGGVGLRVHSDVLHDPLATVTHDLAGKLMWSESSATRVHLSSGRVWRRVNRQVRCGTALCDDSGLLPLFPALAACDIKTPTG